MLCARRSPDRRRRRLAFVGVEPVRRDRHVTVLRIPRRGQQSGPFVTGARRPDVLARLLALRLAKFGEVLATELRVLLRVVTKPLA